MDGKNFFDGFAFYNRENVSPLSLLSPVPSIPSGSIRGNWTFETCHRFVVSVMGSYP